MQFKIICVSIIFLVFFTNALVAQLDNTGFEQPINKDSTIDDPFSFSLRVLSFNKNNEYFNEIVKGYTLFGTRFIPSIGYQLHEQVNIQAGIFLQKDFGNNNLTYSIPYFSILYDWNDSQLIFGNYNGSIHHRMLEPLEDFERLLVDTPENGLQYLYNTEKIFFDAWINWEKMIYQDSPFKEEVSGGLVASYDIIKKNGNEMSLHYQFKGYHRAGQIDNVEGSPLVTRFNNAVGASYHKKLNSSFVEGHKWEGYFLHYIDNSFDYILPYTQGYGYYLNGTLETKIGDFMMSYWQGDHFYSYKGGRLYQSYSTDPNSRFFEDERKLLILRVMNEFHIGESSTLLLRFEPYWDFNNKIFEFSHAVYFNIFKTLPIRKNN
ncbi:hypothetical protein SAMN05661096_02756 [Marivirga sericea]|uniref:Uncharacterized protein n=1 Tax=Marivirga sericea TaxID=1028 RepID=A0A1X7KGU4_9BACT|nr:hypothetical protein [Marivirga sericea]SMG40496.1 hypothetical protein SAMN05661096_02756 [Marivirga sericea]